MNEFGRTDLMGFFQCLGILAVDFHIANLPLASIIIRSEGVRGWVRGGESIQSIFRVFPQKVADSGCTVVDRLECKGVARKWRVE